ncbi:MAG: DUF6263 family protein [Cyanobacteria bacterium P01_F01_bin.150]
MRRQFFKHLHNRSHQRSSRKHSVMWVLMTSTVLLGGLPGSNLSSAIAQHSLPESLAQHTTETELELPVLDIEEMSLDPITLINRGAEPRRILQMQPEVNSQQQSVTTMDMMGTMNLSGVSRPLPEVPTTQMVIQTDVVNIDDDGNRYIEFEYTDVSIGNSTELPPEAVDAMRSQLSSLEGLAGSWVLNEQGHLSQFTMEPPEGLPTIIGQNLEQMMDSVQQMSAPFPQDAIGIGAQWQMPYGLSMNGIEMTGTATYELVGVEGDRITLSTSVTQQSSASNFTGLGLPENIEMTMQQMDASGQGTIEIDLNEVMPIYSDMSLSSDSLFTIKHQDLEMPVSMNMLMNMSIISDES